VVTAAFDAGADVASVYISPAAAELGPCRGLLERAGAAGVRIVELPPGVLERIADAQTPQPVVAVVRSRPHAAGDVASLLAATDLALLAVGVRDPGNAGTLVRTAQASAVGAVLFARESVDITGPKAVRASAGAVFGVSLVEGVDPEEVLTVAGTLGLQRLGAAAHGGMAPDAADLTRPTLLVVGSEAAGIEPRLSPHLDTSVTIPMAGTTESLNVGIAAAVVLFEAARQRRRSSP